MIEIKVDAKIEVHLHGFSDVAGIKKKLGAIYDREGVIMALADDLKAGIAALDAETTNVATRIDTLIARLAASGLTDQEKSDIMASLSAETARLKSLGTDPTAPVPPAPPELAAARSK